MTHLTDGSSEKKVALHTCMLNISQHKEIFQFQPILFFKKKKENISITMHNVRGFGQVVDKLACPAGSVDVRETRQNSNGCSAPVKPYIDELPGVIRALRVEDRRQSQDGNQSEVGLANLVPPRQPLRMREPHRRSGEETFACSGGQAQRPSPPIPQPQALVVLARRTLQHKQTKTKYRLARHAWSLQ